MLSKTPLLATIAILIACMIPFFAYAEGDNPHSIIERTSSEVLKALKEDKQEIKINPNKINDLVDEIILPICDLERMSKYILAKHWKTASIEQRNAFIIEFKQILIRNYGSHLAEYSNAVVTVIPNKIIEDKLYQTVSTKLDARIGSKPLLVDYVFRVADGTSKVVDVRVEGMSILKTFRTAFTREIAETSLVDLIERITLVNEPSLAMNSL